MSFTNTVQYHREWRKRKKPISSVVSILVTIGLLLLIIGISGYFRNPEPMVSGVFDTGGIKASSQDGVTTEAFIKGDMVPQK